MPDPNKKAFIVQAKLSLNNDKVNPQAYETKLSLADENKFKLWLDKNYKEGKIQKGDYNHYKEKGYGYNYDFRAAFKNKSSGGIDPVDKQWHWNDYGKKPNHPTFSNESIHYAKTAKPGVGGSWEGDKYIKNPVVGPPVPPTKEALKK